MLVGHVGGAVMDHGGTPWMPQPSVHRLVPACSAAGPGSHCVWTRPEATAGQYGAKRPRLLGGHRGRFCGGGLKLSPTDDRGEKTTAKHVDVNKRVARFSHL